MLLPFVSFVDGRSFSHRDQDDTEDDTLRSYRLSAAKFQVIKRVSQKLVPQLQALLSKFLHTQFIFFNMKFSPVNLTEKRV